MEHYYSSSKKYYRITNRIEKKETMKVVLLSALVDPWIQS